MPGPATEAQMVLKPPYPARREFVRGFPKSQTDGCASVRGRFGLPSGGVLWYHIPKWPEGPRFGGMNDVL